MSRAASKSKTVAKQDALRSLEEVRAVLVQRIEHPANPSDVASLIALRREIEQDRREAQALVLAVLQDQPCPIALYRPWMSRVTFWNQEQAGKVTLERRNGKLLLRPSDFFKLFASMPAQKKAAKNLSPAK